MASCPHCFSEVVLGASKCPHCTSDLPNNNLNGTFGLVGAFFMIVLILAALKWIWDVITYPFIWLWNSIAGLF
jgi:hypothetical protein